MPGLLKNINIVRIHAGGAGAASATPTKATILDMQGYKSVMFVAEMGDVLVNSVVSLKAAVAATNDTSAMTLLTDFPTGTATATTYDDKCVMLEFQEVNSRYIECQIFHVTADAPFDSILAIQFNPTSRPVTQGSTVVNTKVGLS